MSISKLPIAIVACCVTFLIATPAYAGGCSISKITSKISKLTRAVERAERQADLLLGETPKEKKCEERKSSSVTKLEAKRTKFQSLPKVAGCFTGAEDPAAKQCVKAFNKDGNFDLKRERILGKDCEEKNKLQKRLRAIARADKLRIKITKLTTQLAGCGGDLFDDLF